MDRRTFLALLALPAVAHVLAACGDKGQPQATGAKTASLKGTAPRTTQGADPTAAATSVNAFGAALFDRLAAKAPTANLVFSPASIAVALAMTSAGAKGNTLAEIDEVFHIADPAGIHRSMNGLSAAFAACNKTHDNTTEGGDGVSEVQLNIANSLWGQYGMKFENAFLDVLSGEYGAGMELVDYINSPEQARVAINRWVDLATRDRIPELIAKGLITAETRLTLVNAIYLKADWEQVFPKAATTAGSFATAAGTTVQAQMMHGRSSMGHATGTGWTAVELPYVFADLSFTVAVGESIATALPTGHELFGSMTYTEVDLTMPKFEMGTATSLGSVLADMGMPTLFTDRADLSGMTTDQQLLVSEVVHQANITVNEQGTEAAAATAVIATATGAPVEPVKVVVDRPFTFWIHERSTNAIVFMGRVNDPTAT